MRRSILAAFLLVPACFLTVIGHAASGDRDWPAREGGLPAELAASAILYADSDAKSVLMHAGGEPYSGNGSVDRMGSEDFREVTLLQAMAGEAVPPTKAAPQGREQEEGDRFRLRDWVNESFIDGASITLGYGIRRSSFFFTRKSDNASGTIVDRDYPAYFLIYSTKPSFFENSRFGYTFMVKLSTFSMNQQVASGSVIGGTPVDVHTDLDGIIGYAVPALYYQWGEHRKKGTFLLIGAGLGLATTTYSGTIQLDSPGTSERVDVRDQSYSLNIAWTVFLEARWRHLGGYISIMRARLPGDTYDTLFEDASLYVGYRIFF